VNDLVSDLRARAIEQGHMITVPSLIRDGDLIAVAYDATARQGYIEIPYERTLREISEGDVWRRATELARADMDEYALAGLAAALEAGWQAHALARMHDERRARCAVGRDQLAAIVRAAKGWPL
jgi:hypothetical protein